MERRATRDQKPKPWAARDQLADGFGRGEQVLQVVQ